MVPKTMSDSGNSPPGSPALSKKQHWEQVYSDRNPTDVSWYQLHPEYSLALIEACAAGTAARIIDVGGGASSLVEHLLSAGYRDINVLDISGTAIRQAKARLGARASEITWLEQDVTRYPFTQDFDIWHDRAVFHFLTSPEERARYIANLKQALRPGGHAIIATFSEDGPAECSGLDVMRYSPQSLSDVMGGLLRLVETREEEHLTPNGGVQRFIYCRFRLVKTTG